MEDAIPTTLGTGGNQDTVIACIPGDLYLFEGQAVSHINVETLSGTLQARFTYQLHGGHHRPLRLGHLGPQRDRHDPGFGLLSPF